MQAEDRREVIEEVSGIAVYESRKEKSLHELEKTDERLNSIDQGLADLKRQSEKQDNRLWVLISGMCLALLGILAKFALNP
jgi:chromosome segregation ATPase